MLQSNKLRICLIRAHAYGPQDADGAIANSDIKFYTNQHTFEYRFIRKGCIHQDLNCTAAEDFDLYINFLLGDWCNGADIGAAIVASQHLERLNIPLISLASRILAKCRLDSSNRLLLQNINKTLEPVSGDEYACTIITLTHTPVALSPIIRDSGPSFKPLSDLSLHDDLRKAAENAFYANDLYGCPWCTIFIRLTGGLKPVVMRIQPMPQIFLPATDQQVSLEGYAIRESFPGGYRALIHSIIASHSLQSRCSPDISRDIGQEYGGVAANYDSTTAGIYQDGIKEIIAKFNYNGLVLDLACGTGLMARFIGETQGLEAGDPRNGSKFIGVDVSVQMRTECLRHGWYETVLVGPIQRVLIARVDPVDHIICLGALHYLNVDELSLVLSRAFQLARRSVTFTLDEIPESYNAAQRRSGRAHMSGFNHLAEIDNYGTPIGWKLADRWRRLGWKSPTTGDEVYTNAFRFERLQDTQSAD